MADINYFDLSGGINQATTKTELGINPRVIFWSDSKNIELYNNKGIIKQKGNILLTELPNEEEITAMCAMEAQGKYKLVITTISGKIYVYSEVDETLTLVNKTLLGTDVLMTPFLYGMVIATESDEMFYIKNNSNYDVEYCNLVDSQDNPIYPDCITVYKGRLWCSSGSTIYYSALGTYNDFTTSDDAGYINDFHTDTADIVAMNNYKDYLAVYKQERVYLLSGSNPADFAITPFADKGAFARKSIVNVDNKQFFLSNGIYALEQVGELNQIRLGSEISLNIKSEFERFNTSEISKSFVVHYANKHQVWYFFPYMDDEYYHTIWINDYLNRAWYKRVVPQNITTACTFGSRVVSADDDGKIYCEDSGQTFDGQPIDFMWKSPFLSLGSVLHRKLIDEFYFVIDDIHDNKFNFSIYKDYDSEYCEDRELIYAKHFSHFVWASDDTPDSDKLSCWAEENSEIPVWPISTNSMEKAEICGSNYSIQLCIEGSEISDNCAIIGLQFREIYNDD